MTDNTRSLKAISTMVPIPCNWSGSEDSDNSEEIGSNSDASECNKTNDLILNLTPENVTQHSRIVTTTRKGSSTPTKMSKIIGRQIH